MKKVIKKIAAMSCAVMMMASISVFSTSAVGKTDTWCVSRVCRTCPAIYKAYDSTVLVNGAGYYVKCSFIGGANDRRVDVTYPKGKKYTVYNTGKSPRLTSNYTSGGIISFHFAPNSVGDCSANGSVGQW